MKVLSSCFLQSMGICQRSSTNRVNRDSRPDVSCCHGDDRKDRRRGGVKGWRERSTTYIQTQDWDIHEQSKSKHRERGMLTSSTTAYVLHTVLQGIHKVWEGVAFTTKAELWFFTYAGCFLMVKFVYLLLLTWKLGNDGTFPAIMMHPTVFFLPERLELISNRNLNPTSFFNLPTRGHNKSVLNIKGFVSLSFMFRLNNMLTFEVQTCLFRAIDL